jgi:pseudouridine-5'-monophosphatase
MGASLRRIGAVIFDLDGLLIDSEPLQIRAWERYLERFGAAMSPELLSRMYGLRLVDSAQLVVRELGLPVTAADVVRDRDLIFLAAVPGNIDAMPGAAELIATFRSLGVSLALATSGHRRYVDLALAAAGLARSFDVEVTGDLVAHGKPAPDTYLKAAELLGAEPTNCLALEDAPNGIRSAKAAGMLCFAVPNERTDGLELSAADAVLASLRDVVPELQRRGLLGGDRR